MKTGAIPSLNWLRVFEVAARHESFARAAEHLNMSAPAVSQQIKALESYLGANLFIRSAHAVRLTPEARAWLPAVQQSLGIVETTARGLFGQARQSTITVKSVLIFALGFLVPRLAGFRARHPDINLQLSTGNALQDFAAPSGDFQIIFGPPAFAGLSGEFLLGEELFPVALPQVAAKIKTAPDLLAHPLIEVAPHRAGWSHMLDPLRLPVAEANMIYADSTVMAFAMAASGAGIALARAPVSDLLADQYGLVPCLPNNRVKGAESYHLLSSDQEKLRKPARHFRSWLKEEISALNSPPGRLPRHNIPESVNSSD